MHCCFFEKVCGFGLMSFCLHSLQNISSDAMIHRIFIILLTLSQGEEQYVCTFTYVCSSRTLSHMSKKSAVFREVLLIEGYLINLCSHSQILAMCFSFTFNSQIDATISDLGP